MVRSGKRGRPATFDRVAALSLVTQCFWRHGYEGTSIAMLTEALGVTAPTIYAAFGSKEQLYVAALGHYSAPKETNAIGQDTISSAYELVRGFLRAKASQFADGTGAKGCMIASGVLRGGADASEAIEATAVLRREGLANFTKILEESKSRGEIAATVDCEGLARFYTAVIQGMSAQAIDGASADNLNALVDAALAAWPHQTARPKRNRQQRISRRSLLGARKI